MINMHNYQSNTTDPNIGDHFVSADDYEVDIDK